MMQDPLEGMSSFFTARVDGYDEHMLKNVEGCREGYSLMASRVPLSTQSLLDLGCGTGLELDAILERLPRLKVTGVDLTPAMLERLRKKHPHKNLTLICGDYFTVKFGGDCFDCAVSFQTMHHFIPQKKVELYSKICDSLTVGGVYLECDYMVLDKTEEDFYFAENRRLRREQNIPDREFFHYDTPCTVEHQMELLRQAGFSQVEQVMRVENTTLLVAMK